MKGQSHLLASVTALEISKKNFQANRDTSTIKFNAMELDDISLYATTRALDPLDNFTSLCKSAWMTHSEGIFLNSNPLHHSFPLLLLQIFLSSGVILLMKVLLTPFNQPTVVSQILVSFSPYKTIVSKLFFFFFFFFSLQNDKDITMKT